MSHIPVNHPLRPVYRVLAGLTGVYCALFGVVGLVQSLGDGLFERGETTALGLRTYLGFSLLSVAAGAVILFALFVGRNLDRHVNLWGGVAFMTIGTAFLALIPTDLNFLNFSMATVIASMVIGMVLFSAGLYGKTARA